MKSTRVAAMVGAGMMFVTAPALAGVTRVAGFQSLKPASQPIEQVRYYRRDLVPEEIIGGVISGVLGGVLGGNCYFNDCGYGGGYYSGGGGYVGGGRGGYRGGGGRGGGGVRVSHAVGGGGGHPGGGGGHPGGGGHGGRK